MDDIGVDSIETGVAMGVAMEAGIIPFGDVPGILRLLKEIGSGTPLGRILGSRSCSSRENVWYYQGTGSKGPGDIGL